MEDFCRDCSHRRLQVHAHMAIHARSTSGGKTERSFSYPAKVPPLGIDPGCRHNMRGASKGNSPSYTISNTAIALQSKDNPFVSLESSYHSDQARIHSYSMAILTKYTETMLESCSQIETPRQADHEARTLAGEWPPAMGVRM